MQVFLRYISEILINTSYFRNITFSVSVLFEFHCYVNIVTVHWTVFVIHRLATQIKHSQLCYWSENVSIANVTAQRQFSHPTKQSGIASSKTRIAEAHPSSLSCTLENNMHILLWVYSWSYKYLCYELCISFSGIIEGTPWDH